MQEKYYAGSLFIPLAAKWFEAFERGEKRDEFRLYGPRWNEQTCRIGRPVILAQASHRCHARTEAGPAGASLRGVDMAEQTEVATMPVQVHRRPGEQARAPVPVVMRAYEVYCYLYGEQPAMVTGSCRGGFGIGELLAFLYARSFPKEQWSDRFDEGLRGLRVDAG